MPRRQRNGTVAKWFSSGMNKALTKWVKEQARKDDVHYSFVVANCVSDVSGIPIEEIRDIKPKRKYRRANLVRFPKVG